MNKSGIDYQKQTESYTDYCADETVKECKRKLGSHEFLMKSILDLILGKTKDMHLATEFHRSFIFLKTLRTKADYETLLINESDVRDSRKNAIFLKDTIDDFIKKNFVA